MHVTSLFGAHASPSRWQDQKTSDRNRDFTCAQSTEGYTCSAFQGEGAHLETCRGLQACDRAANPHSEWKSRSASRTAASYVAPSGHLFTHFCRWSLVAELSPRKKKKEIKETCHLVTSANKRTGTCLGQRAGYDGRITAQGNGGHVHGLPIGMCLPPLGALPG